MNSLEFVVSTLDVMNKTLSSSVSNEIDQLEKLRQARKVDNF
jgi:hypothetical protein